jgi:hypothetical protein
MHVINLKSVGNTSFDGAIQYRVVFVYNLASEPLGMANAFDKDFGLN